MKKIENPGRNGEVLFLLLLFGIFILSALSVTLMGARVYEKIKFNMDANYTRQTSTAYITEKIRQHDENGMIELKKIDGKDVLALKKETKNRTYVTYIYEDEYYIKELFVKEGQKPDLSYGEKILKVASFSLEKEDNLYRLQIEDEGGNSTLSYICPRSEEQGESQ